MKKRDSFMIFDVPRIGFEVLSLFDWITPVFKTGNVLRHDPTSGFRSWCFFIPNTRAIHAGWDIGRVKKLLQEHNIKVYGDMVNFFEQQFYVPIDQAAAAENILNQHGIPIMSRSRRAPKR